LQNPETSDRDSRTARNAKLRTIALPILFLIVGGCAFYFNKIEIKSHRTEKVTITGEVVDAWCYASQTMGPGQGEGHKACALACSYGGVTMGILQDGTRDLYIAAKSNKPYKGCNELLIPYIAQKVTVTGWVGTLGGCRMLKIESLTPVPDAASQTKPSP